jgi:hypothetical protein
MDTYSTDSFLMALRRFMSVRGTPTRFQSDRGEQLVAAAKQVAMWDFTEVVQWAGKKGIEWTLVPTGGQHFNGQAERMIGLIKQQLWRTFEGKRLSHEETITVLAEAVHKINSRPITWNPRPEGEPLCVQDLMLGRAKPGQVEVKLEPGKKLTKRFEEVQRAQQEFWKRWIEEVFPQRLKQSKWRLERRDLKIGDIVLRKDETAAGQTYKYAKVVKVHVGTDGKVRAADVEYKLPGESVFRMTTRPIHKLVLIVPMEEQASVMDKAKEAEAALTTSKCAEVEPETESQEESRIGEKKAPGESALALPQDREAARPAARPKKVISRKKAGRQARMIIVTSPKEEAEMVDVKARPKKRGRPRKIPIMDPPDPHKGSVSHPGKGECADPVNEDAILEGAGGRRPGRNRERQFGSDTGDGRT